MSNRRAVLLALTAVVAAACARHTPPSSPPPPKAAVPSAGTPAPTPTQLQPGPHSPLADVRLPAGADFVGNSSNEERWRYRGPYDDTLAFLRTQFATGRKYDAQGATWWRNLPPCYNEKSESPPQGWVEADSTHWLWSDNSMSLSVEVSRPNSADTPDQIVIEYQRWDNAYPCNRE